MKSQKLSCQGCKTLFVAAVTGLTILKGSGALAEDAYIQSDKDLKQYIPLGYHVNPNTKVVCDFAYTTVTPTQQRIFGAASDTADAVLSFASYINGSTQYSWAFQDGNGNWTSTGLDANTSRLTLTLDGPGNAVKLVQGSTTKTQSITSTRTKTGIYPLTLFANNLSTDYSSLDNYGSAKLYAFDIYEMGQLVHCYRPYKSGDTVGLMDLATGAILTSPVGTLGSGGDISDSPSSGSIRYNATRSCFEYLVSVDIPTGCSVSIESKDGTVVDQSVWLAATDTAQVTLTPASTLQFLTWQVGSGLLTGSSRASDMSVTVKGGSVATMTALCATDNTRYWNPKTATSGNYLWNTAENWIDAANKTGVPQKGETVIIGKSAYGSSTIYMVAGGSSENPLYEVRFENDKQVSMSQGNLVLLAGGKGLTDLRKAAVNHWCGITFVGDGEVPLNIEDGCTFAVQKGFALGNVSGFPNTPTAVKLGSGTLVACNQGGTRTYTVPETIIREGRLDITIANTLSGCTIGFDGTATKKLTCSYGTYANDLKIANGGIFERPGTINHSIGAENNVQQLVLSGTPKFNPMVFSGQFVEGAGLTWSPAAADCVFIASNAVSPTAGG